MTVLHSDSLGTTSSVDDEVLPSLNSAGETSGTASLADDDEAGNFDEGFERFRKSIEENVEFDPIYPCKFAKNPKAAAKHGLKYSKFFTAGCQHAHHMFGQGNGSIGQVFGVMRVCPRRYRAWALRPENLTDVIEALAIYRAFGKGCPLRYGDPKISPTEEREFIAGCISELSELLSTYWFW